MRDNSSSFSIFCLVYWKKSFVLIILHAEGSQDSDLFKQPTNLENKINVYYLIVSATKEAKILFFLSLLQLENRTKKKKIKKRGKWKLLFITTPEI